MTVGASERPAICAPERLQPPADLAAQQRRSARQPLLGLAGLLLVIPIAALLAFGVGGPEPSVTVLGPLVTLALPPVALVAFWWDDWPGTKLRANWSGWIDTLLIAVMAIALTFAGQAIVGRVDWRGVFDPTPGPGHSPTFPAMLALAGAAFAAVLQISLVAEGWPLRRLPTIPGGLIALVVSWAFAVATYYLVLDIHPPAGSGLNARDGVVSGAQLGAILTVIGVWQVWFYLAWRGWPFNLISPRAIRLPVANVVVIGGGCLAYALIDGVGGVEPATITAAAGGLIAAGLVISMLFEGAIRPHVTAVVDRLLSVTVIVALAAALFYGLSAYADSLSWTHVEPKAWVTHVELNALSVSVILHVAIGRRWPFGDSSGARE